MAVAGVDMDTVAGFLSAQQQLASRGQRLDFTVDTLHTLCQVTIVTLSLSVLCPLLPDIAQFG